MAEASKSNNDMTAPKTLRHTPEMRAVRTQRPPLARQHLDHWFAVAIIGSAILLALLAPWIAPHAPTDNQLMKGLKPPFWLEGGSLEYALGTDRLGRDVLSRILYGLRISLTVSFLGGALLGAIAGSLAIFAGYLRGWFDVAVQRAGEISLALPGILIALVLALTLGPSLENVILVIVLVYWPRVALPLRGEVLAIRERGFVKLARVANAGSFLIMRRHILPHVRDTGIVLITLVMGQLILTEAALSFLGAGVPPPTPSLGGMIADGLEVLERGWWVSVFPGIVISLLVLSANIIGDWLRDRWDPKLQNV